VFIATLIMMLLVGGVLIVTLGLSFSHRFSDRTAYRFANSVGIGLTENYLPIVRSRLVAQERGTLLVGFVGLLIAIALLLDKPALANSPFGSLSLAGIMISGMSLGSALTASRSRSHDDPDRPRLARARVITIADYVRPVERVGTYIAVGLVVIATLVFTVVTAAVHSTTPSWVSGPGILAALSLASLILFEVAGRRIIRRGQPAGSSIELAWDDALRSHRLRSLVVAPLFLSGYGVFSSLFQLSSTSSAAGYRTLALAYSTATMVLACGVIVIAVITLVTKPQRFFLRRLWPNAEAVA